MIILLPLRHLEQLDSHRETHANRLDSWACLWRMAAQLRDSYSKWHWEQKKKTPLWKLLENKEDKHSDKQGLARYIEDTYNREEKCEVTHGERWEVLRPRKSEKRRHESEVDADTPDVSHRKKIINGLLLTATAARTLRGCEWQGKWASRLLTSASSDYGQVHRSPRSCHLWKFKFVHLL